MVNPLSAFYVFLSVGASIFGLFYLSILIFCAILLFISSRSNNIARAAWNGDTKMIESYLSKGVDVNGSYPTMPYFSKDVINAGVQSDCIENVIYWFRDETPLTAACQRGDLNMIRYLVETCKADVDQTVNRPLRWKRFESVSPLMCAAWSGNADAVEFLLNKGAKDFKPALRVAVIEGHVDVVRVFANKCYDVTSSPCDDPNYFTLYLAARSYARNKSPRHVEMMRFLIEDMGANQHTLERERKFPLTSTMDLKQAVEKSGCLHPRPLSAKQLGNNDDVKGLSMPETGSIHDLRGRSSVSSAKYAP